MVCGFFRDECNLWCHNVYVIVEYEKSFGIKKLKMPRKCVRTKAVPRMWYTFWLIVISIIILICIFYLEKFYAYLKCLMSWRKKKSLHKKISKIKKQKIVFCCGIVYFLNIFAVKKNWFFYFTIDELVYWQIRQLIVEKCS